jgi:hypothetical protein
MKGASMKPHTTRNEQETVICLEAEEIELDLEVLEEVIAPIVGPCTRK